MDETRELETELWIGRGQGILEREFLHLPRFLSLPFGPA